MCIKYGLSPGFEGKTMVKTVIKNNQSNFLEDLSELSQLKYGEVLQNMQFAYPPEVMAIYCKGNGQWE